MNGQHFFQLETNLPAFARILTNANNLQYILERKYHTYSKTSIILVDFRIYALKCAILFMLSSLYLLWLSSFWSVCFHKQLGNLRNYWCSRIFNKRRSKIRKNCEVNSNNNWDYEWFIRRQTEQTVAHEYWVTLLGGLRLHILTGHWSWSRGTRSIDFGSPCWHACLPHQKKGTVLISDNVCKNNKRRYSRSEWGFDFAYTALAIQMGWCCYATLIKTENIHEELCHIGKIKCQWQLLNQCLIV